MFQKPTYEDLEKRIEELEKAEEDHKRTEAALQKSRKELRLFVDSTPDLCFFKDRAGRYLIVNTANARFFGRTESAILGKTDFELMPQEAAQGCMATDTEAMNERKPVIGLEAAGERIYETRKIPVIKDDEVIGVAGIIRDITEQKRVEDMLSESEGRLREIIEFLPDATFVINIKGEVTAWNKAMQSLTGIKASDMLGKGDFLYAVPFYGERRPVLIDMVIKQNQEMASSYVSFRKEEDRLISETYLYDFMGHGPTWLWNTASPLYNSEGEIVGAIESIRDITGHKQAEEGLRESEEKYRTLIENANEAIFVAQDDKMVFVNPITMVMIGYSAEELLARPFIEFIHPQDREMVFNQYLKRIKGKIPSHPYSFRVIHRDGSVKWGELNAVLINWDGKPATLNFMNDITERKQSEKEREKLQAQLAQAQKMESVGRLAGGVAHDFNNMLGVILGHTDMAMEYLDPVQPVYSDLEEIRKAAQRSADLVKQLLAFARKQTISPKVLNLNDTVEGMLKMIRRLIGENIQLVWHPGADLWPVNMDPTQIDQILANLCVNARDAISGVGKVAIETNNVSLDEYYCSEHAGSIPGDYVLLAVSDNGCGMDGEILDKLFEPFFTTKEVGKGTGLGLPTVYGIVKQNEGYIYAYSEPGQGTTFKIYIPKHIGEGEEAQRQSPQESLKGGNETVLLVEDEPILLKMGKKILEKLGYKVFPAETPVEALKTANRHRDDIHLLITDVIMPEINGLALAEKLSASHPGIKCLFMSGYTADVIAHQGVLDPDVKFIQKPFSMMDLANKVREVLES
ncbi:MAG: PAS domain S-box protein [Desulfatiglandaceae bacterium]